MKAISTLWNLIFVLAVLPLSAAQLLVAEPDSVGMSAERLDRINVLVRKDIQRGDVAGTVTLVARKGKVVHFKAHGGVPRSGRPAPSLRTACRLAANLETSNPSRLSIWQPDTSAARR